MSHSQALNGTTLQNEAGVVWNENGVVWNEDGVVWNEVSVVWNEPVKHTFTILTSMNSSLADTSKTCILSVNICTQRVQDEKHQN